MPDETTNQQPGTRQPTGSGEQTPAAALMAGGPPFGPAFFATILHDRVRSECDGHPEAVPVVELHLASGVTLDVCHIPAVELPFLVAQVYRDRETCEDMDLTFVPYGLIMRVTISMWHRSERPIGFDLERHVPAAPPGPAR